MSWLALLSSVPLVSGDVYMHNPPGHNNRLNEASANRNNGNSIMDSQNNNRGGCNIMETQPTAFNPGDRTDETSTGSLFPGSYDKGQYTPVYYAGSQIQVEWTAQHGFGGNEANDQNKLNSNYVLQYMCDTDTTVTDKGMTVLIKNGRNTDTPDAPGTYANIDATKASNDNNARRRHESEAYYYECTKRSRNRGLFLADQKLNGDTAIYTRQNPDGTRRGLECPEERDYFPYWGPTPWVDIAIATDTIEDCTGRLANGAVAPDAFNYIANSMNTVQKFKCVLPSPAPTDENTIASIFNAINKTVCESRTGVWQQFSHGTSAPACIAGDWSRVNHLGNGRKPQMAHFNWTLPQVSKGPGGLSVYTRIATSGEGAKIARCVLRLRYNMSSDDYNPRTTNSSSNDDPGKGIDSPVTNNPTIDVNPVNTGQGTSPLMALKLAINTNQFGRTFQDRSHPFFIKSQPTGLTCSGIWNLNVRGKRGNIVQTFPAVEYDFVPNILPVSVGTCIHMQWGGSNTHNNGEPAGDGQAGDAGEGTTGTDRQNYVPILSADRNIPFPLDNPNFYKYNIIRNSDCYAPSTDDTYLTTNTLQTLDPDSCAVYLATSGYYRSIADANSKPADFSPLLNNASPSLIGGIILKTRTPGVYHGISSRNNNFSNRSTKVAIIVS